jgi:hypothetical protein
MRRLPLSILIAGCASDTPATSPSGTSAASPSGTSTSASTATIADDPVTAVREGADRTLASTGSVLTRGVGAVPRTVSVILPETKTFDFAGKFDGAQGKQTLNGEANDEPITVVVDGDQTYARRGNGPWYRLSAGGNQKGAMLGYMTGDASLVAGITSARLVTQRRYEGLIAAEGTTTLGARAAAVLSANPVPDAPASFYELAQN